MVKGRNGANEVGSYQNDGFAKHSHFISQNYIKCNYQLCCKEGSGSGFQFEAPERHLINYGCHNVDYLIS